MEEPNSPALLVEAWRDNEVETQPAKSLSMQISEVNLYDDEIDESTKMRIRGWLSGL